MPTLKQRCATIFAATLVGAAFGIFAGYFLAREITVWVTGTRLDAYASQLMADGEAASAELRTALAAVDASPSRSCSSGEIGYLRALIFESEYLKDAGRIRDDGTIACSAALGKPAKAGDPAQPDFMQQDGTAIYRNLPQYKNSGLSSIALQRGNSFVVYMPLIRMHLEPAPMRYAVTATDAPTQKTRQLLGDALPAGRPIFTQEGKFRQGDNVYATRCSIRFFNCATAFTTLPEIVQANHARFFGCIGLCGLLGGFAGLAFSLLYRRNKSMEQQLRRAIRDNRLKVAYQPMVDLDSGLIVGAEALARWTDEDGHAIGPDVFIRIAEERGFVRSITQFVVRRILKDFRETLRTRPGFRISINITAADLADPAFPLMLEDALQQASVEPGSLTIEITESSTVRHELAIEAIQRLHRRGHRVHIDDFGTGYSSLAYLQDLSVDAIKIDKAFTQAIGTGSVTVGILPQILAMAEVLKLGVIAEGIETVEQACYFSEADQSVVGQGWLFGRPIPAAEFHRLLAPDAKSASTTGSGKNAFSPVEAA
jgi:sensor c-di-GMP phosphodiesterase-like protein